MDVTSQIEKFQDFIESNYQKRLHDLIKLGASSINVDFNRLLEFDPELTEDLLEDPEEVLKAFELALSNLDIGEKFRIRIIGLPLSQEIKIRDIRSEHLNKLMTFEGIVRQSSDVRPQVISAKFECPSCGNTISLLQVDTKFKEPSRCSCGRRGKFRMIDKALVDVQRLLIEESPESLEGGEQPKRLAVFLKEDLVEPKMEKKTTPGSRVKIVGVIKEIPVTLRTGAQSTRYDIVAEVNSIIPLEEVFSDLEINEEDEAEIKELARDSRIFDRLINSIAPSIYGHEEIKKALVLQLMGGVRKVKGDKTITRGDMHILLVGDPGSGKSALISFIAKAAPKARYIAGRSASGAGITASVVRDEFLRGWALEAGAIVLANNGLLALDEMDKMTVEDTSALHEALEQQTVTISKANIQATLRAQTTVLAAANPKFGRFDPYTSIAQQIDLPAALINRFDLIFAIRDLPDKERDAKIAQHVLDIQQKEVMKTDISSDLLKKYIAYAKQNIFPKLTKGAIEEIKNYYVSLRNTETVGDEGIKPIPISARQLEALVRLAEGSARVRLSNKVTRQDAKIAISLLNHCLNQIGIDPETGKIDIDRISIGITASQRSKIFVIREIINELKKRTGKLIPIDEIISEASGKKIEESEVMDIIERLKREGEIYEPKRDHIEKMD